MARTDLQMTNNTTTGVDDIALVNGDFAFVTSDRQHVKDTINAAPGWWKQFPTDGVGILNYSKARIYTQDLISKARQELAKDGYTCVNPQVLVDSNNITHFIPDVAGI